MIRNVETSRVTVSVTVDVSMDPLKQNIIQKMNYQEALMTLKNVHQALTHESVKTKSHIDIETGEHFYQITCRLMTVMETDDDVYNLGKYELDASILLTTDNCFLIADSSTELVKLVHDIETLCRELER